MGLKVRKLMKEHNKKHSKIWPNVHSNPRFLIMKENIPMDQMSLKI